MIAQSGAINVTLTPSGSQAITVLGAGAADNIATGGGNDLLNGGGGADVLAGDGGNDIYIVDNAGDVVTEAGGTGFDQVYASANLCADRGGFGGVLAVNDYGSTMAINLSGNALGQQIFGNAGANALTSGGGGDALYGGAGDDVYLIEGDDYLVEGAGGGFDQVYSSTNITLTAGAWVEVLSVNDYGSTASLNLNGNALGQQIFGNAGANVLERRRRHRRSVRSRRRRTRSLFNIGARAAAMSTYPHRFRAADDKIVLDHNVFTGLAAGGGLDPNVFVDGTAAQDADDRIIYNGATGALYYDADGNGAGAAIQFATLTGAPAITASDFLVI